MIPRQRKEKLFRDLSGNLKEARRAERLPGEDSQAGVLQAEAGRR